MINRYDLSGGTRIDPPRVEPTLHGQWVLYDEHMDEVHRLNDIISELEYQLDELHRNKDFL